MSSIEQILLDIRAKRGSLTPEIVVEESTPKTAPLHHRFEWNNASAGTAYRRIQAAQIIRSVKVQRLTEDEVPQRDLRGFIHVPKTAGEDESLGEYVPAAEVAADPVLDAVVQMVMRREIAAMSRRYRTYQEYRAELAAEVERLAN